MYIYKATLIENLQYILNILLGFISFFVMIFIFINLWDYIYADSDKLIEGYSKVQMIWYVIFTEIIWFGTRNKTLTSQISEDIKSGTIAYGMNKPYNYIMYVISKHFGEVTIKFFMFLVIGIGMGFVMLGPLPNFNLIHLPLVAITFFLAILISSLIRISISILSFWIEDSGPFQWVYDKLILVIGTLFPIEVFPEFLRPFITFSPIFVVSYGPVKLVLHFGYEMFLKVLGFQLVYTTLLGVIVTILYKKGVKKVNVNGG